MRLIVFGHSHVWAIKRALATCRFDFPAPISEVVVALCGTQEFPGGLVYNNLTSGRKSIGSALLSALHNIKADPDRDVLVSCVQGNQWNSFGMLTDGEPFDFHIPGWPRQPRRDVSLVPYKAVLESFQPLLSEFVDFILLLKTLKFRGIAHISPPPPIPDDQFIISTLPAPPDGCKIEVSDADTRLKLWHIQRDEMKSAVKAVGGVFIEPPQNCIDGQGFLEKSFWKDSVHANAAYAESTLNVLAAAVVANFR